MMIELPSHELLLKITSFMCMSHLLLRTGNVLTTLNFLEIRERGRVTVGIMMISTIGILMLYPGRHSESLYYLYSDALY